MIFPHPGQGAWNLCSLLAQGKQVRRWAVRPCMIFPFLGRTRQSLQGSSRTSGLTSSTSMPRLSWLSPSESGSSLWKLEDHGALAFPVIIVGSGRSAVEWEGKITGSDTVLVQSGTSMPASLSSSSSWAVRELHAGISGTEREWASRGTSLYQFFRSAQQRTQYLWRGVLYFLHSVHCHASWERRRGTKSSRGEGSEVQREKNKLHRPVWRSRCRCHHSDTASLHQAPPAS